jgi:hypothetical protein
VYVQINWSRACPRSVYLRMQEIKSILNVLYHNQSNGSKCVIDVCRTWPTFEKTDLGHVRQQSVTWVKVLTEQVVNVSFEIKKWSYLSHTTFKWWILVRMCASHVGLKVEHTVVKNWFLQIRDILKDRPSCSLPFNKP